MPVTTADSFDPGMNINCILSHCKQEPDVRVLVGLFVQCESGKSY